ncbi:MAG: histidinol-phosphate aminotransferase family protein, partial [Planctomycetes bacterium]|nr:histidinol-phosphate aminotransferase family protein [Planctomycetota bacterium]
GAKVTDNIGYSDAIVIANPNQPTGKVIERQRLITYCETGKLIVIDETYFDFYGRSMIPFIEKYPNLIVLRSFSKGAGLPGLRLGYAIAQPDVIENLNRVQSAYPVNSFALMAGSLVLDHPEIVNENISQVQRGALVLSDIALDIGLKPQMPVYTNFMVIDTPYSNVDWIARGLRERGWAIRQFDNRLRVTLGPPKLMEEFGVVLASVLKYSELNFDRWMGVGDG